MSFERIKALGKRIVDDRLGLVVLFCGACLYFFPEINGVLFSRAFPAERVDLIRNIGTAFISTGIILITLQSAIVAGEIRQFFITAFTDPLFASIIDQKQRKRLVSSLLISLHPAAQQACLDRHIEALKNCAKVTHIDRYSETHTIAIGDTRMDKTIDRNVEHIVQDQKGINLLQLLKSECSSTVYFEDENDARNITELSVEVNGDEVLNLLNQEVVICTPAPAGRYVSCTRID